EAKVRDRLGLEVQTMWSDEGIVVRLPEADEAPPDDSVLLDPDEVEDLVLGQVADSALFAARFRENAARALLLPRRRPGSRPPRSPSDGPRRSPSTASCWPSSSAPRSCASSSTPTPLPAWRPTSRPSTSDAGPATPTPPTTCCAASATSPPPSSGPALPTTSPT